MTEKRSEKFTIKSENDVIITRQAGREFARELGFGLADQTRLATAISELVRNVIQYAGEGCCFIIDESDQKMAKIRIVIEDYGPGISDVEKAMETGFSTSTGLGTGLPGAKRLVHEFKLESESGHTKITMVMSKRRI